MGGIIELEDPATWPQDLRHYLDAHHELFLDWAMGTATVPAAATEYDRAIYGLYDVLKCYSITGWHCTRLTEPEIGAIIRSGMQLPNSEMLSQRIDALERERMINTQIAARLRRENQAHEIHRAEMIWFCFYPPRVAGEGGIERFFRCWGGEALYNLHEDDPETGEALNAIGRPCLVEADVPIASLPVDGGLTFKVVRRFLISRGHQTTEPVDHDDRAERPLPAENIRRIIVFPDPEFMRLTGAATWKQPIQ